MTHYDGNTYLPFVDLIKLEKIDERTYRSTAQPFSPGGPIGLGRGCNFILPGLPMLPFVYKVHSIRDGRSYATRIVNVTQRNGQGICLTCTCSFKIAEMSPMDVQDDVDIQEMYGLVLGAKKPQDFEECPGIDAPWYWKRRKATGINDEFPGLECRKVDMAAFNGSRHPLDRRQLIMYRTLGAMPADPNMHLCAHLYASDRNSLYMVSNHLNMGDTWTQMASLAHTVIFHTDMQDLGFSERPGEAGDDERWFIKEDSTDRVAHGRGTYRSRVFSPSGVHVATVLQDGMIRLTKGPQATAEETQFIRATRDSWPSRQKL
ncbi:Thioesterase-like superfamily [Teratosphaeria destructans]|uniref:Thioesterase-like superfamily n=1 Tax=Teratosphaeria destructans TaxID=418781 RepID=A0A9W7SUE3_9PEZI|nr:Thioesterase-like superfamily [Teratosphaeria destructans]